MYLWEWQWVDGANIPGGLDWIAFILGGVGIGFTVVQLVRSKSALDSAKDALDLTRATLVRNQLVAILPVFEEIALGVDVAIRMNDRREAELVLGRFCHRAAETVQLIEADEIAAIEITAALKSATALAVRAHGALFHRDPEVTTAEIIRDASAAIREVSHDLQSFAVRVRNEVGGTDNA